MKIALLIGVSEYDTQQKLPGCKNDVLAIKQIIDATKEYDDKLVIYKNTNSNNIKQQVSAFFDKHRKSEETIDEIFFYFSGHGMYKEEEFYYILSDFDFPKMNRTTYKNSEIDDLIKSLNPLLTVKIIDACESGVRYVKDINDYEIKKMLEGTKQNFNNCYFMFSSQFNESSYAEESLSYFTESFANSILLNETETIRYRDIMDYISDDFLQKNIQQTPYYIFQGTNTEVFASFSRDLKEELKNKLFDDTVEVDKTEEEKDVSLITKIIEDAKLYCMSTEEVKDVFILIEDYVNTGNEFSELLNIYEYSAEFTDIYYANISNIGAVAKVVNEDIEDFFVSMKYKVRTVRVPIKEMFGFRSNEQKYKEEQRRYLSHYEITEESIPYNYISVDLNPKYPNLAKYNCSFIFAFSKKELMIFHSYTRYKEVRWGEFTKDNINWRKNPKVSLKNETEIKANFSEILRGFNEYVENDLKNHFKSSNEKTNLIPSEK
ncbi:caspase family protein [Bacillus altitudinis]|uniref:caspase family protein n=1 Tax=Bacillus altitudinis TaxID=293387 RepID=UPI001374F6CC|nr:caspase family protein [Bacillus altitudinis]MED1479976.1 caspase family protein [Bacillus altitudinis]